MAIHVSKNIAVNGIDPSTNKGSKLHTIKIPIKRIYKEYEDIGITILNPSIDRLQFGFYPNQSLLDKYEISAGDWAEHQECLLKSSFAEAKYSGSNIEFMAKVDLKRPPYSNYIRNILFYPSKNCEPIELSLGPKKAAYPFLRVDLNPNRVSPEGMKNFWDMIEEWFSAPGYTISKSDFLIWSRIKEIELAVEILGVRPSDLIVRPTDAKKKPKPKKTHVYKSKQTSRIETHYPDARRNHPEKVYDKRQEQLDKGLEPIYGTAYHSRAEVKIGKKTFYKLQTCTNRFKRFSVEALYVAEFDKLPYDKKLFTRVAMDRTLKKAEELLPPELRPEFEAAYLNILRNIWQPEGLWDVWKTHLASSGFVDFD